MLAPYEPLSGFMRKPCHHLRNKLFDRGALSTMRGSAVISVGNLSTGGSGKTPFVISIGELLKERGIPSTSSRGMA